MTASSRFARHNPLVVLLALLALVVTVVVAKNQADLDAYQRSPEYKAQVAREADEAHQKMVIDLGQEFVRNRLRDPSSAQFIGSRLVNKRGKEGVCGYVNAKNGFGGMSGNEAFAVIDMLVYLSSEGSASSKEIYSFCGF